jgi:hypothetical protein
MSITEPPRAETGPTLIPGAPATVPGAPPPVPGAPPTAPGTTGKAGEPRRLTRPQKIAATAVALAALALALAGLYLSFNNVATFAHEQLGFHSKQDGQLLIVGIDLGILTLIAVDLLLAWLGRPVMWIRYPVWLLTGATIALNSASAAPPEGAWQTMDYVAVAAHGIVPILFIVTVEVGRYVIDQVVRPHRERTSIPLVRWLLAPVPTAKIYRQMRLRGLGYEDLVRRDADLRGYEIWLERTCAAEKRKPTADELLPMTLAKHGYTVAEALELPGRQAREADARAAAEVERARERKIAKGEAEADAQVREAEAETRIRLAQIASQAQIEEAERAAEDRRTAAERAAAHLAGLEETAETAEAKARAEKAEAAEAKARAEKAEADRREAEAAAQARELRAREAELTRRVAEDEKATAKARAEAAEAEQQRAEARAAAAEAERRAVEAEDLAKLTPTERAIRKVMRQIQAEYGGDPDGLLLSQISAEFGVSSTTASTYRTEAAKRLREGQDGYAVPALRAV